MWNIVLEEYEKLDNLKSFKESLKKWVVLDCPRKLYKTYVHDAGLLEE